MQKVFENKKDIKATKQNNMQPEKGNLLDTLHHNGKLLVVPNIWDPLGAIL
jgi:2-methylisocitrate lyase-like PEP mutase family enzyme